MDKLDMSITSLQAKSSDYHATTDNTDVDGGGNSALNTNVDGGGNSETQIEKRPNEYQTQEKQSCGICYQEVNVNQMHENLRCHHRFCFPCMARCVEHDLIARGFLPTCPERWCSSQLSVDDCEKFLSPKLLHLFSKRLEEAQIPESEKVYCPYSNCSALMALSTLGRCPVQDPDSSSSANIFPTTTTATKCQKCNELFCIECRVPWHKDMTCDDYASQLCGADAELNLLAENNNWKRCPNCKSMIESSGGCIHITCRCGCQFCYECGRAWNNSKSLFGCDDESNDDNE